MSTNTSPTSKTLTKKVLDISWALNLKQYRVPHRSNHYVRYSIQEATPERPFDIIEASFLILGKFCQGRPGDAVIIGDSWYQVTDVLYAQVADQTLVKAIRLSVPCQFHVPVKLYYYDMAKACKNNNPRLVTQLHVGITSSPVSKELENDNWQPTATTRIYPCDQSKSLLFHDLVENHALFHVDKPLTPGPLRKTYEVIEIGDICVPERLPYALAKTILFPKDSLQ